MAKTVANLQEESDFAEWLRRTVQSLKRGDLPPESWERSPFDDSRARKRIAALIAEIAEKPQSRRA